MKYLNHFLFFLLTIYSCNFYLDTRKATEINYGKEVDIIAKEFNLPTHYLKALIILECSGRKKIKPRFEKHIYKRLDLVRKGGRSQYEGITKKNISDASDEALINLSSSWGPFQLMGYKCLHLNINISDIRGDSSVYWGIKWINEEYGDRLRKGEYENCFRIHNTGRSNGKTHDPDYVSNGLSHINYFKLNEK